MSEPVPQPGLVHGVRRPGLVESRMAIQRLLRFQDLIRHHAGWPTTVRLARPLKGLIKPCPTDPVEQRQLIEREIQRLIPLVAHDLQRASVPIAAHYRIQEPDRRSGAPKVRYGSHDLVRQYFEVPTEIRSEHLHHVLMSRIEMALGAMEDRVRSALWNPLHWIAAVLRAPGYVLEEAGLLSTEANSKVVELYLWATRLAFLLVLYAVAQRLGVGLGSAWEKVLTIGRAAR